MSLFGLLKRAKSPRVVPATPVMRELRTPVPVELPAAEPTVNEVRDLLFQAAAQGDEDRLNALYRDHADQVGELLQAGVNVPPSLAANPDATAWYAQGFELLIAHFAEREARLCEAASSPA